MTTETTTTPLGEEVRARREALGLSRLDVQRAGGPYAETVLSLEQGRTRRPNRRTLVELDDALGWTAGTAASHLAKDVTA